MEECRILMWRCPRHRDTRYYSADIDTSHEENYLSLRRKEKEDEGAQGFP